MNKISIGIAFLSTAFLFAGCNDSKKKDAKPAPKQLGQAAAAAPAPAPKPVAAKPAAPKVDIPAGATEVVIEGSDMMKFNLSEIKVAAGKPVALTLKHVGKQPKDMMGHNLVILKAGVDMAAFATAAAGAQANNYVPKAQADNVIAATKVLGGGESETLIFDAPAAGVYDFLCSFPGHYAVMKGKFSVG